jgi:hypothetical protein
LARGDAVDERRIIVVVLDDFGGRGLPHFLEVVNRRFFCA